METCGGAGRPRPEIPHFHSEKYQRAATNECDAEIGHRMGSRSFGILFIFSPSLKTHPSHGYVNDAKKCATPGANNPKTSTRKKTVEDQHSYKFFPCGCLLSQATDRELLKVQKRVRSSPQNHPSHCNPAELVNEPDHSHRNSAPRHWDQEPRTPTSLKNWANRRLLPRMQGVSDALTVTWQAWACGSSLPPP